MKSKHQTRRAATRAGKRKRSSAVGGTEGAATEAPPAAPAPDTQTETSDARQAKGPLDNIYRLLMIELLLKRMREDRRLSAPARGG
jgi:hypothetical protein